MQSEATTIEPVTQAVEKITETANQAVEQVKETAQQATTPEAVTPPAEVGTIVKPAAETVAEPIVVGPQIGPADISSAVDSGAAEKISETTGGIAGVTPLEPTYIFLLGLGLLALFVWYFASENEKRRRLVGSILAVGVALFCSLFFVKYPIKKGIELRGGVSMEVEIQQVGERTIDSKTQEEVIGKLEGRLNQLGTEELIIAAQGKNKIFLQIPKAKPADVERIKKEIVKKTNLQFAIINDAEGRRAQAVYEGLDVIPGYVSLPFKQSPEDIKNNEENNLPVEYGLVEVSEKRVPGSIINKARAQYGATGSYLLVSFSGQGSKIMGPLTRANLNKRMAIIMDGQILSAPQINSVLQTGCEITGNFSKEEARSLAAALENPLENALVITSSDYISASLGKATVNQGIAAGVAGLIATLLFIVVYYRFAGIVALIGLILNIAIIFGLLALFQTTLTLPGIAGIILTIGVAIDANVLIYERLREELAAGKSLKAAIDTAYEKAFSAIVDANITTLITAVILFYFAVGTVRGFAITLIIGICASLFSALIVTRICFAWSTVSFLKDLKFRNIVPDKVVNFLGKNKATMLASIALVLLSIAAVVTLDPRGVELKGGDKITAQIDPSRVSVSAEQIKNTIKDLALQLDPIIQTQEPVGDKGVYFVIRAANGDGEKIKKALEDQLGLKPKVDADGNVVEETISISSVGSQVGEAMLKSSLLAIGVGLIVILIYVTLRFEFAFALGAIAALFHDLIIVLGVLTLLQQELSLITVGALLTIAGYSINDTIVVFDRVREGLATKRGSVRDIMNYCLNATLTRTILTSATTLLIVVVLFLFGGPGMRNFALTLIIGVVVGTYSSIFVASPIVLWWANKTGTNLRREVLDTEQAKIDPLTTA